MQLHAPSIGSSPVPCRTALCSDYLPKEATVISDAAQASLVRPVLKNLQLLLTRASREDTGSPDQCTQTQHPKGAV